MSNGILDIQTLARKVGSRFGYGGAAVASRRLDDGNVEVTVRHKTLEGPERLTTILCDTSGTEI